MADRVRLSLTLTRECFDQLCDLSDALHVNRNSVVAMAIARFHTSEPCLQERRKTRRSNGAQAHGDDHS